MSEVDTQVQEQTSTTTQEQTAVQQPDLNQQLAESMWNDVPIKQQETTTETTTQTTVQQPKEEDNIIDLDDYFTKEYGLNAKAAKEEWENLRKLKETPPTPQEVKWTYDESKEDDIYTYISQKKQLEKLEKYDIANVDQAAEIIKANLQFKYKDLSPQQIDRLYTRQYSLPDKPIQNLESDEEYVQVIANWQRQVQEKEQDIMIDAKIAKPELINYKSQIVKPDIPNVNTNGQQGPTQEDLAAQKAFHDNFVQKLGTDYKNFGGYNVTAKDKEVELPISYTLNDDEKLAFNATVQKAVTNINDFLDNDLGWWDKTTNSFNINKMQEDLYLLLYKGKVLSKIAGDASAKRFEHQMKIQNNIKLNGVTQETGSTIQQKKDVNTEVGDAVWAM